MGSRNPEKLIFYNISKGSRLLKKWHFNEDLNKKKEVTCGKAFQNNVPKRSENGFTSGENLERCEDEENCFCSVKRMEYTVRSTKEK